MSWIDWIGDTFIILMSISLLIYLATDYRFFRGDLFVLLRSSVHSAVSSVTARLRLALAALAMVGLVSWTWFGIFPANVLIFMSLILAMTVYGSVRPAAAVVLAASRSPHAREIGTEARRVCGLLRVIYFLDPS